MSDAAPTRGMTASEYFAWERAQVDKHEFHFGEIVATAGGSARHNFLASAIGGELRNALRASGCRVFSSDQRIGAGGGKRYVYPDAVVVCGAIQLEEGAADVRSEKARSCRSATPPSRSTPFTTTRSTSRTTDGMGEISLVRDDRAAFSPAAPPGLVSSP